MWVNKYNNCTIYVHTECCNVTLVHSLCVSFFCFFFIVCIYFALSAFTLDNVHVSPILSSSCNRPRQLSYILYTIHVLSPHWYYSIVIVVKIECKMLYEYILLFFGLKRNIEKNLSLSPLIKKKLRERIDEEFHSNKNWK